jgi:hypothetical protein
MKDLSDALWPISVILFVFCAIFWMYRSIGVMDLRQQAIHQGFAEYNATNGVWQWKAPANLERAK